MKRSVALVIAAILITACVVGTAGTALAGDAWYTKIYVYTMPNKTTYTVGESFDTTGLKVYGHVERTDGSTSEYLQGMDRLRVSPSVFTASGTVTVKLTISCVGKSGEMEDFSTTLKVTVNPAASSSVDVWGTGIDVQGMPSCINYAVGDSFDPSGIYVVATYGYASGGTNTGDVTNECYYYPETFTSAGTTKVTVYCDLPDSSGELESFRDTFNVTVTEAAVGEPPVFITGSNLPDGVVGEAYSYYIRANGTADISIDQYYNPGKSNDIPNGMRFSSSGSGHLKGTPKEAGTFTFWAYAANDYGEDYREFTVTILSTADATPELAAEAQPEGTPAPLDEDGTAAESEHVHEFSGKWESDDTEHWRVCTLCGEACDKGEHEIEWKTIKEATRDEEGVELGTCLVCGRVLTRAVAYEGSAKILGAGMLLYLLIAMAALLLAGVIVVIILLAGKKKQGR